MLCFCNHKAGPARCGYNLDVWETSPAQLVRRSKTRVLRLYPTQDLPCTSNDVGTYLYQS